MRRSAIGGGILVLAGAALLASCASDKPNVTPPPPYAVHELPPQQTPVQRAPEPINRDQCGAGELQWLVGRPRTEIPVPVDVSNRRVACTSCPVTEEYMPRRLNIFFDADSGLVETVRCG